MNSTKFALRTARKSDQYWVARASLDFSEEAHELMVKRGLTKADLARKIEKSPAYITKVFRGGANFTLETMVKVSRALGGELNIQIVDKEVKRRSPKIVDRMFEPMHTQMIWGRYNLNETDYEIIERRQEIRKDVNAAAAA